MGPPIPIYEPLDDLANDNIFISKSYDATSHFETTSSKFLNLAVFEFLMLRGEFRRCAGRLPPCYWRGASGGGSSGRPAACSGVKRSPWTQLVGRSIAA